MSRVSIAFAFLLAAVSIVGGILGYLRAGSVASLGGGVGAGVILVLGAFLAARGRAWAQGAVAFVSLLLLGRFLPVYFREPLIWPTLVMILLSSITLAFSLLGLLLDNYGGARKGGEAPSGRSSNAKRNG